MRFDYHLQWTRHQSVTCDWARKHYNISANEEMPEHPKVNNKKFIDWFNIFFELTDKEGNELYGRKMLTESTFSKALNQKDSTDLRAEHYYYMERIVDGLAYYYDEKTPKELATAIYDEHLDKIDEIQTINDSLSKLLSQVQPLNDVLKDDLLASLKKAVDSITNNTPFLWSYYSDIQMLTDNIKKCMQFVTPSSSAMSCLKDSYSQLSFSLKRLSVLRKIHEVDSLLTQIHDSYESGLLCSDDLCTISDPCCFALYQEGLPDFAIPLIESRYETFKDDLFAEHEAKLYDHFKDRLYEDFSQTLFDYNEEKLYEDYADLLAHQYRAELEEQIEKTNNYHEEIMNHDI